MPGSIASARVRGLVAYCWSLLIEQRRPGVLVTVVSTPLASLKFVELTTKMRLAVRLFLMLSASAIIAGTICAQSCSGDQPVGLPTKGLFEASVQGAGLVSFGFQQDLYLDL